MSVKPARRFFFIWWVLRERRQDLDCSAERSIVREIRAHGRQASRRANMRCNSRYRMELRFVIPPTGAMYGRKMRLIG